MIGPRASAIGYYRFIAVRQTGGKLTLARRSLDLPIELETLPESVAAKYEAAAQKPQSHGVNAAAR